MVKINPEKYTPQLKGYLTYTPKPEIEALLLDELYEKRYVVSFGDEVIEEHRVLKPLADLIKSNGGNVKTIKFRKTTGKKKLFDIPVEIRKLMKGSRLMGIRIRVTGDTVLELVKKLEVIKTNFAEYGVKPKECLWDRTGGLG